MFQKLPSSQDFDGRYWTELSTFDPGTFTMLSGGRGIMFYGRLSVCPSVRPSVRPLTPILSDAISLYLVEGFQ